MTEQPKDTKGIAETVTAVLGALTAAAALVVVPGGAAMLLRLAEAGLPADSGVVSSLPTQFLFAIGFGSVLAPLLGLFVLIAAVVVLPAKRTADANPGKNYEDLPQEKLAWVERRSHWPGREKPVTRKSGPAKLRSAPADEGEKHSRSVAPLVLAAIPLALFAAVATFAFTGEPSTGIQVLCIVALALGTLAWLLLDAEAVVAAALWKLGQRIRPGSGERPRPSHGALAEEYRRRVPSAALAIAWPKSLANFFLVVLILGLLVGLPFLVGIDLEEEWWAFAATAGSVAVWLGLSRAIARDRAGHKVRSAGALGLLGGLVIAAFLPWAILFGGFRGELPQTTVCYDDTKRADGWLVGETSERIYVGEAAIRVVSIVRYEPLARLVQEAFRSADEPFDFNPRVSLATAALSRVDLILTDQEFSPTDATRIANSNAIGYVLDPSSDASRTPFELREAIRDTLDRVEEEREDLEESARDEDLPSTVRAQPLQRIIEIPSGKVDRLYVGGSGACDEPPKPAATAPLPADASSPAAP